MTGKALLRAFGTALPLAQHGDFGQASGEPRVAAEHRHTEGKPFDAALFGELIDKGFAEERSVGISSAAQLSGGDANVRRMMHNADIGQGVGWEGT